MSTSFKKLHQLLILLFADKLPGIFKIKTPSTIHFQHPDSALAKVTEARSFEERLGHVDCGGSTERSGLQHRR